MPITKVTIENFKGVRDRVEIPLKPITLLFGANSAGKSTILQALLLLRDLLERSHSDADTLLESGNAINLGGYRQYVHQHRLDPKVEVTIGVTMTIDDDGLPTYPVAIPWSDQDSIEPYLLESGLSGINEVGVMVTMAWDPRLESSWVKRYAVEINGQLLAKIERKAGFEAHVAFLDHEHPLFAEQFSPDAFDPNDVNPISMALFSAMNEIGLEGASDRPAERKISVNSTNTVIPEWKRAVTLLDADHMESFFEKCYAEFILSNLIVGAGEVVLNELRDIRYIGPIRTIPERNFSPQRSPGNERWSTGLAAWDWLYSREPSEDEVDLGRLRDLKLGCHFERTTVVQLDTNSMIMQTADNAAGQDEAWIDESAVDEIRNEVLQAEEKIQLQMVSGDLNVHVTPNDVGVGISQVIPVAMGAMIPGYSILMVEQPELHIHPSIQCELGDFLAHEMVKNRERIILLETHSEHIMLRLLRRLRERHEEELPPDAPVISPDDLSVLYVENEGSQVVITPLEVTEDGDFAQQWPKGFFEERVNELF